MISFFELESQKLDELCELQIKRKLSSSIDIWFQATIEACLELIGKDFNPNERNEEGATILEYVIRTGRLDLVKFLIEAGANVNICNNDNEYPLEVAAYAREIFDYLEPLTSSEVKAKILLQATISSQYKVIQALIDSGIDVDAHRKKAISKSNGRTPLIIAVQQGNEKLVKMFLEAGADPNLKDEDSGTTPLFSAVKRQYVYLTRLLLENGADVTISDDNGDTALGIVMKLQNETELPQKNKLRNKKIIDLLIKAGATQARSSFNR